MKLALPTLFLFGALAGGATAFVCRSSGDGGTAPGRTFFQAERKTKPTVERADLRARLTALEAKLAEMRERTDKTRRSVLESVREPFDTRKGLVHLREKDPEEYARRLTDVARRSVEKTESLQEDLELLDTVDTSRWSADARAEFEEYVELSDRIAQHEVKLAEMRLQNPELPAGYGYDEIGPEILRKYELQCDVRYRLMAEAAKQYGLTEDAALELAHEAHCVVEATLSYDGLRNERELNEKRHQNRKATAPAAGGGQ